MNDKRSGVSSLTQTYVDPKGFENEDQAGNDPRCKSESSISIEVREITGPGKLRRGNHNRTRLRNPFGNFGKSIWTLALTGGPLYLLWAGRVGRLKGGFQSRKKYLKVRRVE